MLKNSKNETELYDLCIVGAGVSGLNALFAATKYLNKNSKVLLIEKNNMIGGMWNNCYDHVRLHQPHKLFTAGNLKWDLNKDSTYLATKPEVINHLNLSFEKLNKLVSLEVKFGCTFLSHEEKELKREFIAISTFKEDGKEFSIKSKKLIKSAGFNIQTAKPLETSSNKVNSITQEGIQDKVEEIRNSKKPVYIVGGGKSGTDAAAYIIKNCPDNDVHLIVGRGTLFVDRGAFFPEGMKRYYSGTVPSDLLYEIATKFNGKNAEETMTYFDQGPSLKLSDKAGSCMFGLISSEEIEFIKKGVSSIENEHFVDVIDKNDIVSIQLKSGKIMNCESEAWIVNCKGYIAGESASYEPYLSAKGTTISVNKSSAVMFLTTFSSYFLTHLLYSETIKDLPLFEIDMDEIIKKDKAAIYPIASQQMLYNLFLMMDVLPLSVLNEWGTSFDNFYPLYRRIYTSLKLQLKKKKFVEHAKKSLIATQKLYGVRCGELKLSEDN